jgi:hypothetical protein
VNSERLYKRSRPLLRVGSREATFCLFVAQRQRTISYTAARDDVGRSTSVNPGNNRQPFVFHDVIWLHLEYGALSGSSIGRSKRFPSCLRRHRYRRCAAVGRCLSVGKDRRAPHRKQGGTCYKKYTRVIKMDTETVLQTVHRHFQKSILK